MPLDTVPLLQTLLSPFRRSQQKTLALVIAAIAGVAQASSFALATHLAARLGIQVGSALRRFYRLLANPRPDDQLLTAQLLSLLGQARCLLIALDWTEWHHPLRMLVVTALVGCRGIPVQVAVFDKTPSLRSQNNWESTFLRLLVHTLRALDQAAVLLCDRGFHRVQWLALHQPFVVRLVADVLVYRGTQGGRCLRAWHLAPGQAVDLG